MKRILLALLLSMPLLASAALLQCAKDAIKEHKDIFQYLYKPEIRTYVIMWCKQGQNPAEWYLADIINARADALTRGFSELAAEETIERRHQEMVDAIKTSNDPCNYAALPEYCRAKRMLD
jgi:hypothetical protein